MYQYFTADCHFNHRSIIKYSDRPFKNTINMNETMIKNINERCNSNDVLYHLGDFMFAKSTQAEVLHRNPENWLSPKIIHIKGNHDKNNRMQGMLDFAYITFANTKYLLCHIPPMKDDLMNPSYSIVNQLARGADCVLCGHVHNNWKFKIHDIMIKGEIHRSVPVINVGVDVWDFRPIKIDEIHNLYRKILKEIEEKI